LRELKIARTIDIRQVTKKVTNKMKTINLGVFFILFSIIFTPKIHAQNTLADIFDNVDTIWTGGLPGHLISNHPDAKVIVTNPPCYSPFYGNYGMARTIEQGRVAVLAHEGISTDGSIGLFDNLTFLENLIQWLKEDGQSIKIKNGWTNFNNTSRLQSRLRNSNYTISQLGETISAASLSDTDVLILGNDWNNQNAYNGSTLTAIQNFVENGGGLLILGLGWSWPENLEAYPMNQVANLFDIEFSREALYNNYLNFNDFPLLYDFLPKEIVDTEELCKNLPAPFVGEHLTRGDTLTIFRLAVSTTGEFTQQVGGKEKVKEEMTIWLEYINQVFGREYSVRFELVPNNDEIIFEDPVTDPWKTLPSNSGGCDNANLILSDQARVIDDFIGAENYDISHVIAGLPYGGGCAGSFKSGLSGGLDFAVTQHEIGHQFGQSHTINNQGRSNFEPENGAWSVQGGNGNSQGHAHAVSFHQLVINLRTTNRDKGRKIATGNTIPTVDAGPDRVNPINTPFTLNTEASDEETNEELTYIWDNMNYGIQQSIPIADDSQGALFMRLLPQKESTRTFPRISDVLLNRTSNSQEQLPSQPRNMDIRVTVNDQNTFLYEGKMVNASGTNSDDIRIVVADAGPFEVTSQNTIGITYQAGDSIEVSWSVNGTDVAPINTTQVKISLSTNSGITFDEVLSEQTPNDGFERIVLPDDVTATRARIKIEAVDNIYFNVNRRNFTIKESDVTSVSNSMETEIRIFPNPSDGVLQIEFQKTVDFEYQLSDLRGRVLASGRSNRNKLINLSSLENGIYFLQLIDLKTRQKLVRKVIVMK